MKIDKVVVGPLETNCYIVTINQEVVIIDPGDDEDKIKEQIGNKKVKTLLITHKHFDHIGALDKLSEIYQVPVNAYDLIPNIKVIATPGHTKDSKCYYFPDENVMFCGDFLFQGSFGRTDLDGNNADMLKSLKEINKYPNNITLMPGHGNSTTLGQEKPNFPRYLAMLKNS